ncbi:MAG: hypothetical protein O3A82_06160 [Verrucomicrobia bacterium]|jgi:hypothetical protein|nr:hypothetical protein [Verrucomicrobiota bacterium]
MVSSQRRLYDRGAGLAADLFDPGRRRARRFDRHLLCIDCTTIVTDDFMLFVAMNPYKYGFTIGLSAA